MFLMGLQISDGFIVTVTVTVCKNVITKTRDTLQMASHVAVCAFPKSGVRPTLALRRAHGRDSLEHVTWCSRPSLMLRGDPDSPVPVPCRPGPSLGSSRWLCGVLSPCPGVCLPSGWRGN